MSFKTGLYTRWQCFTLIFYFIILLFGLCLYSLDFGIYGEVIYNEVSEWDEGEIVDVITTNGECPSNYTMLESLYLGTDTVCAKKSYKPLSFDYSFYYTKGSCSSSKKGRTVVGYPDTWLS
jgi:hypothetical protein